MAHPRDVAERQENPLGNEFGRVVNALAGLVWAGFPEGRIDVPDQCQCECRGLALPKPAAPGAA